MIKLCKDTQEFHKYIQQVPVSTNFKLSVNNKNKTLVTHLYEIILLQSIFYYKNIHFCIKKRN